MQIWKVGDVLYGVYLYVFWKLYLASLLSLNVNLVWDLVYRVFRCLLDGMVRGLTYTKHFIVIDFSRFSLKMCQIGHLSNSNWPVTNTSKRWPFPIARLAGWAPYQTPIVSSYLSVKEEWHVLFVTVNWDWFVYKKAIFKLYNSFLGAICTYWKNCWKS